MFSKFFNSDILFSGYYGQLNSGDDAFVEVASWGAKKYWNKNHNIFLGKESHLPRVSTAIRGYPFEIPKTYRLQSRLLLSSTKVLISAGGSTLHTALQASNVKRLAIEKKRKGSGVKVGGIGVSIGPFRSVRDENAIFEYLRKIDFLAVRDQASFNIVNSLDLPYEPVNAFDLAALLPEIYEAQPVEKRSDGRKILGVSLCRYESIVEKGAIKKELNRNKKMIELLQTIEKKGNVHFKFFIINGHPKVGDSGLTRDTINVLRPFSYEILDYNKETRHVWNEISSCDFLISTRLHAAIFACFSNTPFMLNEYHRKCSDFLENVSFDRGLMAGDCDFDPLQKAGRILDILENSEAYKAPTRINEMKSRAKLNFTGISI